MTRVTAGVRPVFLVRNDLPIYRLLAAQTLEQVRDDLPHVGQVALEVFGSSVFRQTGLQDVPQILGDSVKFPKDRERVLEVMGFGLRKRKGGNKAEGSVLHFDIVSGEGSHCRVEIVPQLHVHIAHIHIGYLLLTPFGKGFQQCLD